MYTEATMYGLHERWAWSADQMRCRACNRAIHVTRLDEEVRHAADCPNEEGPNPWAELRVALNHVAALAPTAAPAATDTEE